MRLEKRFSSQNLQHVDHGATKRNVSEYFIHLENLKWQQVKLNAQKGLKSSKFDIVNMYKRQAYTPIGKDIFNITKRELLEDELKQHLVGFEWARSILSDEEQIYIMEYFIHHKYEDEIIDLLGFNSTDSLEFKRIKRSAVYKFADFLNLVVEKKKQGRK